MYTDESIPLEVATRFFAELTKRAEWTEPPDMTGALEGQFAAPVEQVLAKLKEVITAKLRKMVAYYTYAQSFNHHSWRAIKTEFGEHAEDEQCGAEFYMKRATVLGGPILIDAIEPPPPTTNPHTILMTMARAEQEGIFAQRALRQLVGDDNPMKVGIEEHMLKDQHHLDELFQMMAPQDRLALEQGGAAMQEPPPDQAAQPQEPAAEEKPKEKTTDEKVAAMRLALAKLSSTAEHLAGGEAHGRAAGAATGVLPGIFGAAHLADRMRLGAGKGMVGATVLGGGALGALGGSMLGGQVGRTAASFTSPTKTAAERSDDELKETGRQRAVTNLSAEAHREKGRRGERAGGALGGLAGAVGGAALARKYMPLHTPATLGGGAAGYLAGSRLGRELGSEIDIAKNAAAREKFHPGTKGYYGPILQQALETGPRTIIDPEKVAAMQLGAFNAKFAEMMNTLREVAAEFNAKTAAELGMGGEEMSTPSAGELEPVNYLRAEMAGRQAQEQNESAFYRQRLGEVQAAQQQMQSQMQNSQMQMQSLQETADQANAQIEQAMQQATMAQDQATQQALEAARARMGAQQLRAQILQVASQDPSTFGDPAMGLSPTGPVGGMGPSAPADPNAPADPGADPGTGPGGPAAAAPDQQQAGATAPGGTGEGQNTTGEPGPGAAGASQTNKAGQTPTTVNIKTSSAGLAAGLGAAAGGILGAGKSLLAGPQAGALRGKVQSLQGTQDGSFRAAAELAATKGQSAEADLAAAHPQRSALSGGLRGAMLGAAAGPALFAGGRELYHNVRELVR